MMQPTRTLKKKKENKGLIYKKYKQYLQFNNNNNKKIKLNKQPNRKMGRRPKQKFLQRMNTFGQQAHHH